MRHTWRWPLHPTARCTCRRRLRPSRERCTMRQAWSSRQRRRSRWGRVRALDILTNTAVWGGGGWKVGHQGWLQCLCSPPSSLLASLSLPQLPSPLTPPRLCHALTSHLSPLRWPCSQPWALTSCPSASRPSGGHVHSHGL